MNSGSFIFVLHSHVPYVRKAGKWPHGEEMLHEIIAETYLPLLNSLNKLHSEKIPTKISLGLTPVLLEQLADPYMQQEFVDYIKRRIKSAKEDLHKLPEKYPHIENIVHYYIDWYTKTLDDYEHTYNRDLITAFKYLQDKAGLDILTSAATHGYLPLLSKDSAIRGQLKTGIKHYKKYFGRNPTGIWLPECAYRPISLTERVGLENFLEEMDLQYFFTDSHVIESALADNQGVAYVNREESSPNSYTLFQNNFTQKAKKAKSRVTPRQTEEHIATFQPYKVGESEVMVFGRDKLTSMQVWSAQWGYPGDFLFREFHKKAVTSGIQYWKITDKQPGMKHKHYYNPQEALKRAEEQALHFSQVVTDHLSNYKKKTGGNGIVVSSYDTELFGHWWFEGIHWLECVIRNTYTQKTIHLKSAREYIDDDQPANSLNLPESSWGNGGQHSTWLNPETEYMWPHIHQAEQRFEKIVRNFQHPTKEQNLLLNQAARETLLLQSSDWPFLISTVQAKDFAQERFNEHLNRFNLLCQMLEQNQYDGEALAKISDEDNVFRDIDYKDFM